MTKVTRQLTVAVAVKGKPRVTAGRKATDLARVNEAEIAGPPEADAMVFPLISGRKTTSPHIQTRKGFTLIELIVVVVIIGTATAFALPSFQATLAKESVRNARRIGMSEVARARGTAAMRGCSAILRTALGYGGRIWVTSCNTTTGAGRTDTVGTVQFLDDDVLFSIPFGYPDTLVFDPTGLSSSGAWSYLHFSRLYAGVATANWVAITPLGGVHWY